MARLANTTRRDRFLALGPAFAGACLIESDGHGFTWYVGWTVLGLVFIGLIQETVEYVGRWRAYRQSDPR